MRFVVLVLADDPHIERVYFLVWDHKNSVMIVAVILKTSIETLQKEYTLFQCICNPPVSYAPLTSSVSSCCWFGWASTVVSVGNSFLGNYIPASQRSAVFPSSL